MQNNPENTKPEAGSKVHIQGTYSLEHRFFITSCLVGAIASLLATVINLMLGFAIALTIATFIFFLIFSMIYFFSRKGKAYKVLIIPFIFSSLLAISYTWFINGGSSGPVFYLILTALLVFIVITRNEYRYIAILVIVITTTVLFLWEYRHPEVVTYYTDVKTKFLDLYFTALVSIGLIAYTAYYIMKNYHDEREQVLKQHDKIAKQNQEIREAQQELIQHKENLEEIVKIRTKELESINLELITAIEKAEESDRLKTAFLSNMSHEIRTPMNAIIGFSNMLKEPDTVREEMNDYIDIIINKGNLLLDLINDIIDISKVEANEIIIHKSAANVSDILDEIYLTFINVIESKKKSDIKLILSKSRFAGTVVAFTDPNRLKQVISNLVDNAIKFTHAGTVEFGFSIEGKGDGKKLKFYVKDTGIGISEENKKIIFTRFRQIEESNTREYGGTGLGLAISKKLVELLGGSLLVESEYGKGSLFYFTIPFEQVNISNIQDQDAKSSLKTYSWETKKILIVEDNPSSILLLKKYLEKTRVEIIESKNGKDAIEICQSDLDIDLILMDIELPLMNGYEATKQIKSFHKNLPIIAQTAYAMSDDEIKAKEAGCDAYIKKPIMQEELLKMIGRFLG